MPARLPGEACLACLAAGDFTGQDRVVLAFMAPAPAGSWQTDLRSYPKG